MFQYQENITDSNGTALNGWSIGLYAVGGDPATAPPITIYADRAGTVPIPGGTVRAADKGYVSFYVPAGTYSRRYYNSLGIYQYSLPDTDMGTGMTGLLPAGAWVPFTGLARLKLGGVGTVTIDANTKADGTGTTTSAVYTATVSGSTITFPFFGTDAVAVRATYTGTASAEII